MSHKTLWAVQLAVLTALAAAYFLGTPQTRAAIQQHVFAREPFTPVVIPRSTPLVVKPLYDRPDFVSDDELAAVLDRIVPRFGREHTKPNFVEHAVRVWGVDAEFEDPQAMSGRELAEFLTDHARYAASWGTETAPLVQERAAGLAIRFGSEAGASVHHDHWLASLTEGGISRGAPVYGPSRLGHTINDVLQESLCDFRLDERETEWTAMAFGLWLPPCREWIAADGRRYSFDLLARRLIRGQLCAGVCSGTHRVYSLMLLIRLDDAFDILSEDARSAAFRHLEQVRDLLAESQQDDGRWPADWYQGSAARKSAEKEFVKDVVATGHHLEWLAIAPRELHPPEEQIRKAARWVIGVTTRQTSAEILPDYTYYSHVGNALALWRSTPPAAFWRSRRAVRE